MRRTRKFTVRQHSLVDRNSLVWKRVDTCGLARECRVELVTVGQAMGFGNQQDRGRVASEIQRDGGCRQGGYGL